MLLNKLKQAKGQISSPFELLVLVIIMSFVVLVGSQVLIEVRNQSCLTSVNDEISEFVNSVETTSKNRSTSKFVFQPVSECYDENKSIMKIIKETNQQICSSKCGTIGNDCFMLVFFTSEVNAGYKERCINIPIYTNFSIDPLSCTTLDELAGYNVVDPNSKIPFGEYIIKNVARTGDSWPNICIYYKGDKLA